MITMSFRKKYVQCYKNSIVYSYKLGYLFAFTFYQFTSLRMLNGF